MVTQCKALHVIQCTNRNKQHFFFGFPTDMNSAVIVSANNTAIQSLGGEKVFGLAFAKTGTGPEIIFGGRDTTKFVGSLTYVNLPKNPVRILQGVPCLRLTPTQYRSSGSSCWILSQSTERTFKSPVRQQLSTRSPPLSQGIQRISLISIAISPVRSRSKATTVTQVRMSRSKLLLE